MSNSIVSNNKANNFLNQEQKTNNIKLWITFFRRNIHRFIEMYLGVLLHPHQRLEFYLMGNCSRYAEVCSRGTGKSWKAGLFAVASAILYPNSEIVIVSASKKQASIIIDKKIRPLYEKYVNIHDEIDSIVSNNNENIVRFKNGSTIFVVPLRDSARGNRATKIIYEEFRLLDKDKIESIISPFKHPRQVEYLKNPLYAHLVEEPQEIFITSSGRDTDEFYSTIRDILLSSLTTEDNMCIFMDYIIGLRYSMQTIKQILKEKSSMDEETFRIEYENALIRENKDSFFPNEQINNARVLKIGYYPQPISRFNPKKNIYGIPKQDGEKIILSVDIALKASSDNDNTIITVDRLIPTKKGYQQNFVYQETMRGRNSLIQALRIKQIWYDFNANYIVMDVNNAGSAIFDIMTELTIDSERGLEYPAMTSMYHSTISKYDDYKQRTRSITAIPIIYPMWATDTINSEMAYMVRDSLNTGLIRMLCKPDEGEEFLVEQSKFFDVTKDADLLSFFMVSYYQASETQNEMTNLKPIYTGNYVKLIEPPRGRKDRYTTIGYATWFVKKVLDPQIVREIMDIKPEQMVIVSSGASRSSNLFNGSDKTFRNNGRKLFS